jgi:hypothetical protein
VLIISTLVMLVALGEVSVLASAGPAPEIWREQGVAVGEGTVVCGAIEVDTHWTIGESPFVVTCGVEVLPGIALTLDPGVVVKFQSGTQLEVRGSLHALGTTALPIAFTSASTTPAPGDWSWLRFTLEHSSSKLQHVVVEYGGLYGSALVLDSGSLTVQDSAVRYSSGVGLVAGVMPTVMGTEFRYNDAAAMELRLSWGSLNPGTISGNWGTGNGVNGIYLAGTFSTDVTLGPNEGLPYFGDDQAVGLSSGHTLTVAAGAVFKLDGTKFLLDGTFRAPGEAGAPIVFTSWADDSFAGDTNGDGSATQPAPADWRGLTFRPPDGAWSPPYRYFVPLVGRKARASEGRSSSSSSLGGIQGTVPEAELYLNHVLVRYAGYDMGNVEAYGGRVWILDSTVEHSAKNGVHITNTSPEIRNSTIAHNVGMGLWLYGTQVPIAPILVDNHFTDNGTFASYVLFYGGCHPDIEMHGNVTSGNGQVNGIYMEGYIDTSLGCRFGPNAEAPYVIWGLAIRDGARLILEPGVTVKFAGPSFVPGEGTINITGTVEALGTVEAPIAFTSFWDDTLGGDTDGTARPPAPADWIGFLVRPGGQAVLDHAIVRYGGADGTNLWAWDGALQLTNSEISYSAGAGVAVLMEGISRPITLRNDSFVGNVGAAVTLNYEVGQLASFVLEDNSGADNGVDGILLSATLDNVDLRANASLPYILQSLTIPAGKTVTVEPSVVFKADESYANGGSGFNVMGSLHVGGTPGSPVYFTSLHDDTVGGDTLGDGGVAQPASGDWRGISVTGGGQATIGYTHILYGGSSGGVNLLVSDSALDMDSSVVAYSADQGLHVQMAATGPTVTVRNSKFTGNDGRAVAVQAVAPALARLEFADNEGWGNGVNGIVLEASLDSGAIEVNPTLPYVIQSVVVPSGKTVTVEPGVVFKADQVWANGGSGFAVDGVLTVLGEAASPVYFTSLHDDTVGGDTLGDGATQPGPGDWRSLSVNAGGQATLDHAVLRYGGSSGGANLAVADGTLHLADSTVAYSADDGLYNLTGITGPALTVRNCTFTGNAGWAATIRSEAMALANFRFQGNGGSGNGVNGIVLDGTLDSVVLEANPTLPYVIRSVSVPEGRSLEVAAGVIVKSDQAWANGGSGVNVSGELEVEGTENSPVYFTSLQDDTVGGDTLGDGNSYPNPGDWRGISLGSSADVRLVSTVVRYAGYDGAGIWNGGGRLHIEYSTVAKNANNGLNNVAPGSLTVTHSVLSQNARRGLVNGGTASVSHSNIMDNGEFGIYSTTFMSATYNYWGSADGPDYNTILCPSPPAGSGDQVTCHTVTWLPFAPVPYDY